MGDEWCSLRPLFIDRWVRRCGVQKTINCLIMDLVAAHPEDVMAFIHAWSAPRRVDATTPNAACCSNKAQQEENVREEQGQSHVFEWPSSSDQVGDRVGNEDSGTTVPLVRAEEPTVQELRSRYPDARTSPFALLVSEENLDAQFRRSRSVSASSSGLSGCMGRGNYGFVVPAVLLPELGSGEDNPGNYGNADHPGNAHTPASGGASRMVAIKVSRVQAAWSLDEANSLRLVTESRHWLEQEVQRLQQELDALRETRAVEGVLQPQEEDAQAVHPKSIDAIAILESRLQFQSFQLQGARRVTSLAGDVMYDVERDAMWFPLDFYPSSLKKCIRARRKICTGSFSVTNPFPDIMVNNTGDTVMALFFSVREIQHVAWNLCCALHFLNTTCCLCHLDVKVDNILLSSSWVSSGPESNGAFPLAMEQPSGPLGDTDGPPLPQIVLGDLGLAQRLGTPIMQLGDFSTMAPEVYWAAENPTHPACRTPVFCASSDMWSVGCVLLQMINGLEYGGWGTPDLFAALEDNYLSPALRHPEVWPMQLNDFIARCFERDPRRRMQAGDALHHPFLSCL
ncbi:putative protein kinase [Trypanosoma rangeli]|uniref:Protein kinase domain-containing protein n=1 Tax=Trypanosoma rangeli TaxID=5698 RepID=A0A422NGI9_TRYRA|nr:putative protein kinase [Trypanosoma rangeli]RNF04580.1 putative protein kinase [Trypanosoma rangeli]|eukprot:RNF04580.1 putative protein kinase [Trypanosoma rangeli]